MFNDFLDQDPTRVQTTPGTKLFGRYKLVERIGTGRQGEVWKAEDERLHLTVAIKLLVNFPQYEELAATLGRTTDLTHPNIVRTYDLVGNADLCGVVMELVEGEPLSEILRRGEHRYFEAAELRPWALQLFNALKYAWESGRVLHGDIRPANLLIGKNQTLKLAEFYMMPLRTADYGGAQVAASNLSLPYSSPQRVEGELLSHSDDIYSAGTCLYEALTGKPVFPGGNMLVQIQRKIPLSITERRAELGLEAAPLPQPWEDLIASLLAKSAAERPESAAKVVETLEHLPTSTPRTATFKGSMATAVAPLTQMFQGPKGFPLKTVALAVGAVILCLFIAAAVLLPRQGALKERRLAIAALETEDAAEGAQPEERAHAWESYQTRYASQPVAFTSEDEDLLALASERVFNWNQQAADLAAAAAEKKREDDVATARLEHALQEQIRYDELPQSRLEDRLNAWNALLAKYAEGNELPAGDQYQALVEQARATQQEWQKKDEDEKRRVAEAALLAEQSALQSVDTSQEWLKAREQEWAALNALPQATVPEASAKLQSLAALETALASAPAGAEKRVSELRLLISAMRIGILAATNAEVPTSPLPLDQLLAGTPAAGQTKDLQRTLIFKMQEKLAAEGLYSATADGDHGPKSHAALIEFQKKKQLLPTGALDAPTLQALGLETLTLEGLTTQSVEFIAAMGASSSSTSTRRRSTTRKVKEEEEEEHSTFGKIGRAIISPFRSKDDDETPKKSSSTTRSR